jgi:formylglycine-generating enzyme required for sulfatase activity
MLGLLVALGSITVALPYPSRSIAERAQEPNRQLKRDSAQPSGQQRIALVIGNGAYANVKVLPNPPNDAALVATTLKQLGFEVTSGINKTQREMKQLIREFGQKLRTRGGVGLFYFAGHGVQAKGRNYMIPIDAEIQTEADLEDAAVELNYVLGMMDDAQNALNIVILDACRNNPFTRSFRSTQDGLAQVKAPTGTLIAYATSPDATAADGGGANSPYTEELTKQMSISGVLLETMFRRVTEQVSSRTGGRQEPWYSNNAKGEFYFSRGPANSGLSNTGSAKIDAVAVEREYWETIRSSNDPQDYKDYIQAYPNGAHVAVAHAKIRQLETSTPANRQPSNVGGNESRPTIPGSPGGSRPKSFRNQQGIELVYVPAGEFIMGGNSYAAEKPVHRITVSNGFYMGKYEVTQAQWQTVMGTSVRDQRDKANPSWPLRGEGDDYPMYYVNWSEAQEFIQKLNEMNDGFTYRLPTEAEWEYACRAGTTGDYAGTLDAMAWYGNNSGQHYLDILQLWNSDKTKDHSTYWNKLSDNGNQTHAVGTKQPNAFGLYDMLGNVWEWCEDWYHDNYSGAPTDDSAWVSGGEQKYRVLRGGSWRSDAPSLRSAGRLRNDPGNRNDNYGFRVVAIARTQ